MKIIQQPGAAAAAEKFRELERQDYLGKRIRFGWSQTRGGIAIFASGRMEGPLHDSEEAAAEWLREELSIVVGKDGRGARAWTTSDIAREEAAKRKLVG